jgi:hypothetical protein
MYCIIPVSLQLLIYLDAALKVAKCKKTLGHIAGSKRKKALVLQKNPNPTAQTKQEALNMKLKAQIMKMKLVACC